MTAHPDQATPVQTKRADRPRLSVRKKLFFCLFGMFCIVEAADLVMQLVDWQLQNPRHGQWLVKKRREASDMLVESVRSSEPEVVHPYVGFVLDPTVRKGVNEYGFVQIDGPILRRDPNRFILGVTGGSVARDLCETQADFIRKQLESKLPHASGKPRKVELVCCAQQGFKQPQQLMTWVYLTSVEAEFDAFVNLDGFNEVALYPFENPKDESSVYYPRKWDLRIFNEHDGELNRLLYRGKWLRSARLSWAKQMSFADLIPARIPLHAWQTRDSLLQSELVGISFQIAQARARQSHSYSATGPARHFSSSEERTTALVENWSRNSALLADLCRARQTAYVHVLQPNLHVSDSKPFTTDEKALLAQGSDYQAPAAAGYPVLCDYGRQLALKGIHFYDGTQLFAQTEQTVYADGCCHFNEFGNLLLAEFVCDCVLKTVTDK